MDKSNTTIAFYGLGNMGRGMALNLVSSGYSVNVYDLVEDNMQILSDAGATSFIHAQDAIENASIVITMLPTGDHVERLFFGEAGIVDKAKKNTLFIDCSTIDAESAKSFARQLTDLGHRFCDAPVSGGVVGSRAGTLTFIVGGTEHDVHDARPILEKMGQNIFHAGDVGAGQIAKICNNMLLAVLMTATSEAIQMGVDNGLDAKVISQIMSKSSGNNWTLEKYNPCPGVMPGVPSSNDYQGGFLVDLMNKDLSLAVQTAALNRSPIPMGSLARSLYQLHAQSGKGQKDFSSIFELYANKSQ